MKQRILFIVNPNSGVNSKERIPKTIEKGLNHTRFEYEIAYTKAPKHAIELSQNAIKQGNFDIIAAVGGDGSINEVASPLIGTDKILAVLPYGSGNGFAMFSGIGRGLEKGLKNLNNGKVTKIDTCTMNDQPFLNLSGFGFDGLIAYKLAQGNKRGFLSYFQIAITQAFSAKSNDYTITIDDKETIERSAFLMEIGNGTMFGYGFTIVPTADLKDGLMDLLMVKKANKLRYLPLVPRLLFANIHKGGKLVEHFRAKKLKIQFKAPIHMHYDGEGFMQEKNEVTFQIKPKSLNIILPV